MVVNIREVYKLTSLTVTDFLISFYVSFGKLYFYRINKFSIYMYMCIFYHRTESPNSQEYFHKKRKYSCGWRNGSAVSITCFCKDPDSVPLHPHGGSQLL